MHGLGNDFILIDGINQLIHIDKTITKILADRHLGIGFDQLLLIEKSHIADFACRIFNSDGSEANQCGNGMRCVARFLQEESLTNNNSLTIETKSGVVDVTIHTYEKIEVTMGTPYFTPEKIPFLVEKQKKIYDLEIDHPITPVKIAVVSMGNPHAILQVNSITNYPIAEIGAMIAKHPAFPESTNVGFLEIVNRSHIRLRTYERGAGATFACGTNACAAVVAGIINHWLDHQVVVELNYGNLDIEWQGLDHPVIMTGPASRVFLGSVVI